jgi:C-terminal processing protease CtpA/Prc
VQLHFATYNTNLPPHAHHLDATLGYLELPAFEGSGDAATHYGNQAQQGLRAVDQSAPCGWIVDVRRNMGGNMWPMVAGVGPILGEGKAGSFVNGLGQQESWGYSNGQSQLEQHPVSHVDQPYALKKPMPPVAVLTSRLTASSGEAITVAFRGRPKTRSFGEATAGVPTANTTKPLSDGALLVLTVALDADRTGQTYDQAIAPDQPVKADWTLLDTQDDPVIKAAVAWLHTQGCA